jgi:TDG/mug DNA glycosylase family protein
MKHGLAPIIWPHARILILGSLPGDESLRRQQYYGNPRNQFWAILERVFGDETSSDYPARVAFLERHDIALWDVFERAERVGSLDSSIRNEQANDFTSVFHRMPHLRVIALNGSKAAAAFARHVQPRFAPWLDSLRILALPSTSPVPARKFLDLDAKTEFWRALIAP